MEPQFIRAYRAEGDEGSDDGPITFVASSEQIARDLFAIAHDAWDLRNFNRNAVMQWAHDYSLPPIGKVKARIDSDAKALMADVTFDRSDPFAAGIERKYREGFLNAVSVGFDIKEIDGKTREDTEGFFFPKPGSTVTKAELLELSAVPVPADPKALMERAQRGLTHDLSDLLAKLMSDEEREAQKPPIPESHAEVIWPGTALLMARLYLDMTDDADDEDRLKRYRVLERRYKALGKEPPEFLTRADLCLLDDDAIRGLFGSGEAELLGWDQTTQRAGAVLSTRNKRDLEQAVSLVRGVIERAVKDEQEEADRAFLEVLAAEPAVDDWLVRLAG